MQKLTPRQHEICDLLLNGLLPKEIAGILHITYDTVLYHQKKLYRNLGVNNVQELIAKYPTGTILIQRAYDKISLRAQRYINPSNHDHGENVCAFLILPTEEFPPHFSRFTRESHRYAITISGTADHDLDYGHIRLAVADDDGWPYLGDTNWYGYIPIKANVPFAETIYVNMDGPTTSLHLKDHSAIVFEVANEFNHFFDEHPDWNKNNGSIPADIPNGQVMANISNFTITFKDTRTTIKLQ